MYIMLLKEILNTTDNLVIMITKHIKVSDLGYFSQK